MISDTNRENGGADYLLALSVLAKLGPSGGWHTDKLFWSGQISNILLGRPHNTSKLSRLSEQRPLVAAQSSFKLKGRTCSE